MRGLQAAIDRDSERRREMFAYGLFVKGHLKGIWKDEFKLKIEEMDHGLPSELEPFKKDFGKALTCSDAIVGAGPEGLPYAVMLGYCQDAEQAMGRLFACVGARRAMVRANVGRSQNANDVRHKENRADREHLRAWFIEWRRENPKGTLADASREADLTRQTYLSERTIYKQLVRLNKEMTLSSGEGHKSRTRGQKSGVT